MTAKLFAVSPQGSKCRTPLQTSSNTLEDLTRLLETEEFRGLARVVTLEMASSVLSDLADRGAVPTSDEASRFAAQLVGVYPAREVNDYKMYAAGLTALLSAFPRDFVKRVVNPVTGLPSRLKFLPTLAEVREALEREKTRRETIAANARYVIAEHERRKHRAEEDARYEIERGTAEYRAQKVRELLEPRSHSATDVDEVSSITVPTGGLRT